jgi:peptide/nickel transport system permease protein
VEHKRSFPYLIARAIFIILIAGFAAATMVRLSPGFGSDYRLMDARLSAETVESIRRERDRDSNPLEFYWRFCRNLVKGDLGKSVVFGQPVGPLIRERAPETIRAVTAGLVLGWFGALAFAWMAAFRRRGLLLPSLAVNGVLLSLPSAVLATICLLLELPPGIAIAAVIMPRAFPYAYEQLRAAMHAPHVAMARARGISAGRILVFHIAPTTLAPLVALAGVTITIALGAAIPIEALGDSPGLGQMAWRAALGRDLPVLVYVTLMLTVVSVATNVASELILVRIRRAA